MISRCLVLLLLVVTVPCVSVAEAGGVLLLHSASSPDPWTEGVREGVIQAPGEPVTVSRTFLGSPDQGDDYFDEIAHQLASRWGKALPAVVVVDGEVAFAFSRKYRELLFPGVPIVYCGMDRPTPELLDQCGDCTGVPVAEAVQETLALLFTIKPDVSMVVGITDGRPEHQPLRRLVESTVEAGNRSAATIFPGHEPGDDEGLDMDLLRAVASSVPRSGGVLLLGMSVDNRGRPVSLAEVVRVLGSRADAPVFVLDPEWVRDGVVGSAGVAPRSHGRRVADVVRRILAGEAATEIVVESSRPRPVVDLTAMARFGLNVDRLPPDTVRLNPPPKPPEDPPLMPAGWTLVGVFGGLVVLVVAVWGAAARRGGRL